MTTTTYQTMIITAEQLGSHVMLVEWLIKLQGQVSIQQRLIEEQQQKIAAQQQEIEQLKEQRDKLKNRDSKNSSVPPSSDQLKKPSDKSKRKKGKKRGPKYNHQGKTRNGFGTPDQIINLERDLCPICETPLELVEEGVEKVQQVAEIVEQPVEIREYRRPLQKCPACGWSGYSPLPPGVKEGFSYGARLSSIVGWLGYGGNLTWRKQENFVEYVFGIPISQGSLAKMHKWFAESLEPVVKEWLKYIQQPGIRCVDETTYCIDGIKYWVWVATSPEICVLMLAPTRSSAEVEKLLGADFEGILSSDCYGAYFRQSASAKQKCLAHLERELESLKNSRFEGNRQFARDVLAVLMFSFLETMRLQGENAIVQLCELLSLAGRSPPGLSMT